MPRFTTLCLFFNFSLTLFGGGKFIIYITVTVRDLQRIHVKPPHPGAENEESSVVYWDAEGHVHSIDLTVCAQNYARDRGIDPVNCTCAGERDCIESYFELWTSGLKTRIEFPKLFPLESRRTHYNRFHKFQFLLNEAGYSTLDLT